MRIAVVADHNGIELKAGLVAWLREQGHQVDDRGGHPGGDQVLDYPVLCSDLAGEILAGRAQRGLVIGGSGSGEHMACNKIRGIRAGLALEPFTTEISRKHNDANVLVLGAKVLSAEQAEQLTALWLRTEFAGGRHQQRLDQLAALERGERLG